VTRATRLGYNTLPDYYRGLESDANEFNELLNLVTINETSFFRFPAQWDALRGTVLPEIMAEKEPSNRNLRIWSAGCSTGEEPYTLSMTLLDMGLEGLGWKPQVLGTDVSTRALGRAKAGVYGKRAMSNIPKDVLLRHYEPLPTGEYRINDNVRRLVDFGYHNLIKEPYPLSLMGNWDVIFCRNVTIYFQIESTRRVVQNFYNSLNEGGYLFIGHSETLTSINDKFEALERDGVFLYRKPKAQRVFTFGQSVATSRPRAVVTSAEPPARPTRPRPVRETRPAPAPVVVAPVTGSDLEKLLVEAHEHLAQGRPDRVQEIAAQILAFDVNNADAHLLFAYVKADTGDFGAALASCDRALAINPLLPVARYILGIIYQREGDPTRAISEFKKTIYIDADFALAHLNMANIYKSQRKWDLAARAYENALRSMYNSPEGPWTEFSGGFKADLLVKTCERSLLECQKAIGKA